MTSSLISAILAVRNGGTDLGRAIDTVLVQAFTGLELLVVNDGSTGSGSNANR